MAKKRDEAKLLKEAMEHYQDWTDDMKIRLTRKNGWNDITDAYWGKLPEDWPYDATTIDPRIRTSLIEKTARLVNSRLRGRVVPREGSDMLSARVNNAVIDHQWENANFGGSMEVKIAIADQDTRMYASKFALVYWRYEEDDDGNVTFDGNEMKVLDIRDCGIDPASTHIRNANWFQNREWVLLDDLDPKEYKTLDEIRDKIRDKKVTKSSDRKDNEYLSRVKQLKGLEDRTGQDNAFPVIEKVVEYRKDMWIEFAPQYNQILRIIDNPYDHKKIPISQLRYYPLQDDPLGESEVEPVLGLWRAIQATVCGYLDEQNMKIRPPLKIRAGEAQIETIEWGADVQWLVNNPDDVTEHQSSGQAIQYFQTSYSSLVSAFNSAMGDLSQGTSTISPFESDKTATEVRSSERQRNTRDQKNQGDLSEFITDVVSMWIVNNKQFLFSNPEKKSYILRVVGKEKFEYFQRSGMDEMDIPDESMQQIQDIIMQQDGQIEDADFNNLIDAAKVPTHPVFTNPDEKDPSKLEMEPKIKISDLSDSAELTIVPEDLEGIYDYIPDIKSMSSGASEELQRGRMKAIELITGNPTVLQLLSNQGYTPQMKELLSSTLEELGLTDAERFFQEVSQGEFNGQDPTQGIAQQAGGLTPPIQGPGLPETPQTNSGIGAAQQVAGAGAI